jgi:hypothetical protein
MSLRKLEWMRTALERMWVEPPGYICRAPGLRNVKFAFTNFGVCLGLQAADVWPERVTRINTEVCSKSEDNHARANTDWAGVPVARQSVLPTSSATSKLPPLSDILDARLLDLALHTSCGPVLPNCGPGEGGKQRKKD